MAALLLPRSLLGSRSIYTFSRSLTRSPTTGPSFQSFAVPSRLLTRPATGQQGRFSPTLNKLPQRYYATVVVHNKARSRLRRVVSFLLISSVSFAVGGYYAIHYSPPILTSVIMGSHVVTDEETLSMYTAPDDFSREIDQHIKNSPLAISLRNDPTWRESRPHLKIPEAVRQHNLTAGTLAGPGMVVVPPYYFNKKDGSEMVQIMYVGTDVSGHPGIVHGGFLATMLDEGLARCAFPAMKNKVGVTANLQINYRQPTMAGQFLVLRAKTTKVDGRKAWATGWIESLEVAEGETPEVLVEAEALFIEPKHAKLLKSLYRGATD